LLELTISWIGLDVLVVGGTVSCCSFDSAHTTIRHTKVPETLTRALVNFSLVEDRTSAYPKPQKVVDRKSRSRSVLLLRVIVDRRLDWVRSWVLRTTPRWRSAHAAPVATARGCSLATFVAE
jgi:hypothetical protein